ncbi:interferon-inducible GTPase 5-like [Heteronotia binoei]|uniref:interferon-inducible GTPase 5-like n=1 Tax=Heteronotia binoei TaxID=13085 RepID=UPI00292F40DE|nr:interferon-inducible GTPase 5-like [Heteronotia binoei]
MSLSKQLESLVDELSNFAWNSTPQKYYNVINQIIELFKDGGKDEIVSEAEEYLKIWESTDLNIAVTGEAGAGKSLFINTMLGLSPGDVGAAPIGVTETTQKPDAYFPPNFPNVTFWDLPGIGTPGFPPETYLKQVNFHRYDFFIIICSKRFHSTDVQLAQEIEAMGKKFYFVRSKVDEDLRNSKRANPRKYSKEKVLKEIKDDCKKNLEKHLEKQSNHQIFLIDCWDLEKFDFPSLLETLEEDLPTLKSLTFVLSLPNCSPEVIQKKKKALKKQLWKQALVSAFINAVPIPALTICCDTAYIVKTMLGFYKQFGLDDSSLTRLACWMKKSVEELKAVIQSPPAKDVGTNLLVKAFGSVVGGILSFAFRTKRLVASGVASGVLSFVATYYILSKFLDEAAEDAERVLTIAQEHAEAGAPSAETHLKSQKIKVQ